MELLRKLNKFRSEGSIDTTESAACAENGTSDSSGKFLGWSGENSSSDFTESDSDDSSGSNSSLKHTSDNNVCKECPKNVPKSERESEIDDSDSESDESECEKTHGHKIPGQPVNAKEEICISDESYSSDEDESENGSTDLPNSILKDTGKIDEKNVCRHSAADETSDETSDSSDEDENCEIIKSKTINANPLISSTYTIQKVDQNESEDESSDDSDISSSSSNHSATKHGHNAPLPPPLPTYSLTEETHCEEKKDKKSDTNQVGDGIRKYQSAAFKSVIESIKNGNFTLRPINIVATENNSIPTDSSRNTPVDDNTVLLAKNVISEETMLKPAIIPRGALLNKKNEMKKCLSYDSEKSKEIARTTEDTSEELKVKAMTLQELEEYELSIKLRLVQNRKENLMKLKTVGTPQHRCNSIDLKELYANRKPWDIPNEFVEQSNRAKSIHEIRYGNSNAETKAQDAALKKVLKKRLKAYNNDDDDSAYNDSQESQSEWDEQTTTNNIKS